MKPICVDDRGPFTVAHSGRIVHVLAPTPDEICIEDIAWHLNGIVRFTGAVSEPWSVLDHSLYVADLARAEGFDRDTVEASLLHDAHEAYTGDVSTPIKLCLSANGTNGVLGAIQGRLQSKIYRALGIVAPVEAIRERVHRLDRRAFVGEWRRFMPESRRGMCDPWAEEYGEPNFPPGFHDDAMSSFCARLGFVKTDGPCETSPPECRE